MRRAGPAHCRRVPLAQGEARHTRRTALIGSSGEPRPLSCIRAGSSIAAIFVDVSAPRGSGGKKSRGRESAVSAPSSTAAPCYGEVGPQGGAPAASLGVQTEARRSGVSARGAPGADRGVAVAARRGRPLRAGSCASPGVAPV